MKDRHVLATLLLLGLATGFAPLLATGCTAAAPAPEWRIVHQGPIEQPLRLAAFHNRDFGITGGPADAGKAHATTDGGETWIMADSSAA